MPIEQIASSLPVLLLIAWHPVFRWTSSSRVWAKMAGQRTLGICLSPSQCWNDRHAQSWPPWHAATRDPYSAPHVFRESTLTYMSHLHRPCPSYWKSFQTGCNPPESAQKPTWTHQFCALVYSRPIPFSYPYLAWVTTLGLGVIPCLCPFSFQIADILPQNLPF